MELSVVSQQVSHDRSPVRQHDQLKRRYPQVCILTETYFPVVGGGETQARVLAEGLAERGWRVSVVTRRTDRSLAATEAQGKVLVHRVRPIGSHHLKKWGLLFTALWALLRLRRRYDALIVSGFRLLGIPAAITRQLFGTPAILKADSLGEMSGDFFAAGLARLRLKPSSLPFRVFLRVRARILEQADCYVAISSAVARELASGGVPSERIERIPNSVDTERFTPPNTRTGKSAVRKRLHLPLHVPIVVYTGRLVSYKGLPLLLRVWRQIHDEHPTARLVLVGAGGLDIHSCEDELKDFVRLHGLTDSVLFTGEVANVHEYLQAADIFVLPTENEAFGIALVEAMAAGLPVISTRVGGIPDIVRHEENGLLVDGGDQIQLRDALIRLLGDRALAARIGETARLDAVKEYSTLSIVEAYAMLVHRLLGKSERSAN